MEPERYKHDLPLLLIRIWLPVYRFAACEETLNNGKSIQNSIFTDNYIGKILNARDYITTNNNR